MGFLLPQGKYFILKVAYLIFSAQLNKVCSAITHLGVNVDQKSFISIIVQITNPINIKPVLSCVKQLCQNEFRRSECTSCAPYFILNIHLNVHIVCYINCLLTSDFLWCEKKNWDLLIHLYYFFFTVGYTTSFFQVFV